MSPVATNRNVPILSPQGGRYGDTGDEWEGAVAVGGDGSGAAWGGEAHEGSRVVVGELSASEADLEAVWGVAVGGVGASAAWSAVESPQVGCGPGAGGGALPGEVRGLWSDAGVGALGERRRPGGAGDDAAAVAASGGLMAVASEASGAPPLASAEGAAGRAGADGWIAARLVRGAGPAGVADGDDRRRDEPDARLPVPRGDDGGGDVDVPHLHGQVRVPPSDLCGPGLDLRNDAGRDHGRGITR